MRDFSIDIQTENIKSNKTKEYFNEVVKSYYSESYRSAVVMLYSIAIADLVYKIEELKEQYNDSNAIEILDVIKDLQTRNPTSPDWESRLIELIKEKTNLLEPSDYLHLINLQKQRHLCAHPVLTQNFELYRPNRETTRAHIRNILEGILTKPAFLSRKIFDDLLENLTKVKNIIYDSKQLEKHLKSKFLDKVNFKTIQQIFRSLWKITFNLNNTLCNENRRINLKALIIIFESDYKKLLNSISTEKDYYSDIDVENLNTFVDFLNQYPNVFEKLNNSAQILIKNIIEKDADFDTFSIFLSKNIETHINKILEIDLSWESKYETTYILTESIITVFNYALNETKRDLAFEFIIKMFANSDQYSTADSRCENLILSHLNDFTKDEFIKIIKAINNNSQIYDRRKAKSTNYRISLKIDELFNSTFDYKKYPNFKK